MSFDLLILEQKEQARLQDSKQSRRKEKDIQEGAEEVEEEMG